jgi:hypothetical protein
LPPFRRMRMPRNRGGCHNRGSVGAEVAVIDLGADLTATSTSLAVNACRVTRSHQQGMALRPGRCVPPACRALNTMVDPAVTLWPGRLWAQSARFSSSITTCSST